MANDDAPTTPGGPFGDDANTAAGRSADSVPRTLGPYRLLHKIGEGGMGEVWFAEQKEPLRRDVAVKIIKRGMDSRAIIARFEAERQALALMNHTCIAKVLDAGAAPDGSPYFVMEYVAGMPLNEFCDCHKLDTRQRLQLFTDVCQGVQHAHQKAVIHRDLKPTNVLVTEIDGKPVPKIIDFGVAKATAQNLAEQTMFTAIGSFIGTPEYMSPEQADLTSEDVDTRADIYSLGVMLYELLAGSPPFDIHSLRRAGIDEMRRVIRDEDPLTPSRKLESLAGPQATSIAALRATEPQRLRRSLQGDLDWIVLKAMEKDRNRRYETANGLAADIGRFLADEPVMARPPSAGYRLGKLIRRNRGAFRALIVIFVVLVLGVTASSWGLWRAKRAEHRAAIEAREATRQAAIAQAVNDFLNNDLLSAAAPSNQKGRGIDVRIRDVLDVAAARLDSSAAPGGRFADKPLVEAAIRKTLGNTYLSCGDYEAALPQLVRAVALRTAHQGEDNLQTAWAHRDEALALYRLGRTDDAERELRHALDYGKHAPPDQAEDVAEWKVTLALIYQDDGRLTEATSIFEDVLHWQETALGEDHLNTVHTMTNLANIYQRTGRYDACEAIDKRALAVMERTVGENAPETLRILNNLGNVLANQGHLREARQYMIRALEAKKRILGPENPVTLNSMNNVAEVDAMLGDWTAAEELHRQTYELRRRVLGEDHPLTLSSLALQARAMAHTGDAAAAETLIVDALKRTRRVRGPDHPDTDNARGIHAMILLKLGRHREAEQELRSLVNAMKSRDHEAEELELAEVRLALALMARDEKVESVKLLDQALPALPLFDCDNVDVINTAATTLERWNAAEPGKGYGEEAARLRGMLGAEESDGR